MNITAEVLRLISENPGITTHQLADKLGIRPNRRVMNACHQLKFSGRVDGGAEGWMEVHP